MAHTNQGGVKNYLGRQKMVKAPLHWQSAPHHPTTELAYITKKERDLLIKKDLHKSLKGGVNRGPSGIMSLNGWGDAPSGGQGPAGGATTGGGHGETGKSYGDQERSSVVPGGGTVTTSPKDTFGQSWSGQPGFLGFGGGYRNLKTPGVTPERGGAYKSRFGLGTLGRGLLSIFGGIPGKIASGFMTARDLAQRTGTKIGEFGEEVEEFGNYPTLDRYLNRDTDKYKDKPYRGQGQAEGGRIGYNRGRVVNPGGYAGSLLDIFSEDDLWLLAKHKYDANEVATWKPHGRKDLLNVLRNPNYAQGGLIGYFDGGIARLL